MSEIFITSDTHFDHENIIAYCNRPFKSVEEMNKELVRRWNLIVSPVDTVYHLGDVRFGRGSRPISYWFPKLNGKKVLIKGSHDTGQRDLPFSWYLHVGRTKLILVHDPDSVVRTDKTLDHWVIHGHFHNTQPFVNLALKRLNVSVELTAYAPLSLKEILAEIYLGGGK